MNKSSTSSDQSKMRKRAASDAERDKVFKLLFLLLKGVMNAAKCELDANDVKQYASALATKIFRQTCTVVNLLEGSPIPYQEEDGRTARDRWGGWWGGNHCYIGRVPRPHGPSHGGQQCRQKGGNGKVTGKIAQSWSVLQRVFVQGRRPARRTRRIHQRSRCTNG